MLEGAAGASLHVLLGLLAYYATRIETAGHLSTWIGLQLLASQRMRMGEILKNLLPEDMVEMVLSLHFKSGNEPLPITLCRSIAMPYCLAHSYSADRWSARHDSQCMIVNA